VSLLNIETSRLILRPFTPADAAVAAQFLRDPDVIRFMGATPLSDDEVAETIRGHAARYYERLGMGALAGVLKSTDHLVGRYALLRAEIEGAEELEVSYLTSAEYRRHGYAREAVQGILAAAWGEGRSRIVALIRPDNTASLRLAEGLGFQFEKDVQRDGIDMGLYVAAPRGDDGSLTGR